MGNRAELEEVKKIIRATLISNPNRCMSVNDLYREYKGIENEEIPFRKFNCRSTYDFLVMIPDTVKLLEPGNRNSLVLPVANEQTQHVDKLVREQKTSSKKLTTRPRLKNHSHAYSRARPRRFLQRPILNADFKRDVHRLLLRYPMGISWDDFDTEIQRMLLNHYLHDYDTEDVVKNITEFALYNNGKVFLNTNHDRTSIQEHGADRNSDRSIILISDDECLEDEDVPSVSRPLSRCAMSSYGEDYEDCPFVNDHLISNLRALLEDSEHANGIWMTKLIQSYQLKFGYSLSPKDHGFTDVLDMVANLTNVFFMKQYRAEGDHLLLDARKYSSTTENKNKKEGEIPRVLTDELVKLLKNHKQIYSEQLFEEYQRMYHKQLRPEQYGFESQDTFLQHLEDTCNEFTFRRIVDRTVIKLNYAPTEVVESRRSPCEALPGDVTYDPFPPEVCNGDFNLGTDPSFEELKEGDCFEINFGEIYTPGKFYITHISNVKLLNNMMTDLNEFYECHEEKYKMLVSLVSRNLLCACMYSKNSQWHRVRILSHSLKSAKIFFIDYGTIETVSTEKLRYLHKDFAKHPPLCMQARLSAVRPIDGDNYSDRICREFYRLYGDIDLEAEIVHKTSRCLEIILYALVQERKVVVHEDLINRNLVHRKEFQGTVSRTNENVSQNVSPRISDVLQGKSLDELRVSPGNVSSGENLVTSNADNVTDAGVLSRTTARGSKAFFDKMATNSNLKKELKNKMEENNFSWLRNQAVNPKVTLGEESQKVTPKPPPGIPIPQLPRPESQFPNQTSMPLDINFPYQPALCGQFYTSPYTYYNDSSLFSRTTYPSYPIQNMVYPSLPNLYTNLSMPHYQYPSVTRTPSSFRPPPGINLPPMPTMWSRSNVPVSTFLPMDYRTSQSPRLIVDTTKATTYSRDNVESTCAERNPLLLSSTYSRNTAELTHAKKSPILSNIPLTPASDYENCHSKSQHSEDGDPCSCKLCPSLKVEKSKKVEAASSQPQPLKMNDEMKKMVEKIVQDGLQKALNNNTTNMMADKSEDQTANISVFEEIKSLRERQAAESKLKEYLGVNESNEDEDDYAYSSIPRRRTSPLTETSVYASEFILKTKPKIRSAMIDSEVLGTSASPSTKNIEGERMNQVRAFVRKHQNISKE